ncbi:hypothetical protein MGAD_02350 [Mycolicibacterium gadium]|uniref:Nuclease n=1 Tax=Mycolicibacterium gadium TaxID=1794 RepID=A0A7I7WFP7_MYCGU|nr:hypothetical protein MGAD_02350 [Mycolicibacterium gadium]
MKLIRRLAPALGLLALVVQGMPVIVATAEPVVTTAEVLRVVDGDTIDVRDDVRGRLRIRVLGIFPVKYAC